MTSETQDDVDMALEVPDEARRNQLLMGKMIAAAVNEPGILLNSKQLAKRTGLSEWQVRNLLTSDEYGEMIAHVCKNQAGGMFYLVLHQLRERLEAGEMSDSMVIKAGSFLLNAMEKTNELNRGHSALDATARAAAVLEKVKAQAKMRGPKITVSRIEDDDDGEGETLDHDTRREALGDSLS